MPTDEQEATKTISEHVAVEVRRATLGELPQLSVQLFRKQRFAGDLENAIIHVVEHGGIVSGAFVARPMYEGELILYENFIRDAPPAAVRRAIFRLARATRDWIASPENVSGARSMVCCIEDEHFAQLAQEFGMLQVYKKGIVVGIDTARR